jgi:4-amino-4-deoxy-L-arabinose transferase-like glycosyltransferase
MRKLLSENYPLLGILLGIGLVSISIGPFQNWDTQLEYEAASGVLRWGMPYMTYFGNMINQPPLGFYTEALFFKVFGLSIDMGVALVTLFGLGCTVLVYKIGKVLYGKPTALFAAALFALTPWQITLSRNFLIDVQCLFFSLLCLFVGMRNACNSQRLVKTFHGFRVSFRHSFSNKVFCHLYADSSSFILRLLSAEEFETHICCGCVFFTRRISCFLMV